MHIMNPYGTQAGNSSPTEAAHANTITGAEITNKEEKGPTFADFLTLLAEMTENVREGRPADLSEEEARRDPGLAEFKNSDTKRDEESDSERTDNSQGMNRIRKVLGTMGFKPNEVEAYIQTMKMPDIQGADNEIELDQAQHQEELETQQRQRQIDSQLTTPQQNASSRSANDHSTANQASGDLVDQLLNRISELQPDKGSLNSFREEVLTIRRLLS